MGLLKTFILRELFYQTFLCFAPILMRIFLYIACELLACFYIAGEQKVADWLARTVMTRMGWFTPPFDTADDVKHRLEPYYEILDFNVEGAMLYFRARKR